MRTPVAILAAASAATLTAAATAQLRPSQVLVVYDSRLGDSAAVARHYAGSASVPGGSTFIAAARPGVRVLDLSTIAGAGFDTVVSDITYPTFVARLRDPIRVHLAAQGLTRTVRCLVLTRGLPHRILHTPNLVDPNQFALLGDNPGFFGTVLCSPSSSGNLNFASVDSELTLLQQNLSANEAGVNADSFSDGMIINPYWKSAQPIGAFQSAGITIPKAFSLPGTGFQCSAGGPIISFNGVYWTNTSGLPASLTPGDIYLVTRLDAASLAATLAMIDRARAPIASTPQATFILDKDSQAFDASAPPALSSGTDYDLTQTLLFTTSRRFPTPNIRFNAANNWSGFLVGPNVSFSPQTPVVISNPIILVASYGANHSATSGSRIDSTPAAGAWGTGFNYAPGAVFTSVESYSARAFNGLGQNPFVVQQQTADVLAAGATFAIGHAWEPLSWTIADNQFIVQNFHLGTLSWAEAAWSSIPVLSWQHVVLGDPLARLGRSSEDLNADGRVDIEDLYAWRAAPVDLNFSGAADDTDFRILETIVRRAELTNLKADQR